jgi:hypothetical protein
MDSITVTPVGDNGAVLTYTATMDQTCGGGQPEPSPLNSMEVWTRRNGQRQVVSRSDTPVHEVPAVPLVLSHPARVSGEVAVRAASAGSDAMESSLTPVVSRTALMRSSRVMAVVELRDVLVNTKPAWSNRGKPDHVRRACATSRNAPPRLGVRFG